MNSNYVACDISTSCMVSYDNLIYWKMEAIVTGVPTESYEEVLGINANLVRYFEWQRFSKILFVTTPIKDI